MKPDLKKLIATIFLIGGVGAANAEVCSSVRGSITCGKGRVYHLSGWRRRGDDKRAIKSSRKSDRWSCYFKITRRICNMNDSAKKMTMVEIFFGFYSDGKEGGSDGKEGSRDGGNGHLFSFPAEF